MNLDALIELYSRNSVPISVDFRKLVPSLSTPNRATHLIHPYPAKLIMHIPHYFLSCESLSKPGDLVLDPFSGSGTVLLESILLGRNSIGTDVSPLARLISRVKTLKLDPQSLEAQLKSLADKVPSKPKSCPPEVINIDYWFYPHVIRQLQAIKEGIEKIECKNIKDFFLVCFSSTIRRVSLADPRISVPVKLTPTKYPDGHRLRMEAEKKLRMLKHVNVFSVFHGISSINIKRVKSLAQFRTQGIARIAGGDAKNILAKWAGLSTKSGKLKDGCVQIAITSPPYAGAQKYIRAMSLSIGWLGLGSISDISKQKSRSIGREEFRAEEYKKNQKVGIKSADQLLKIIRESNPLRAHIASTYLLEMSEALMETHRVVRKGGYLVLVTGNNKVCGKDFETTRYLEKIAINLGFRPRLSLVDDIQSRGLMTKRNKTASIINSESVMLFQKD